MTDAPRIVVLTGSGISAESGLGTFRDKDGLWTKYSIDEVATPEAFARDPAKVQWFYNQRRRDLLSAEPNAAHRALATLEAEIGDDLLVVTQNVDDLHERAGSTRLIHMHGELLRARCQACGDERPVRADIGVADACGACGSVGTVRPAVVWFGEIPLQMERIWDALRSADLFVAIGTSGEVYPAAAFVQDARRAGARTLEINLERTTADFHEALIGPATETVPAWCERVRRVGP